MLLPRLSAVLAHLTLLLVGAAGFAQAPPPYPVGQPLGAMTAAGTFDTLSAGVHVYGGIVSAESCVYDAERQLILLINRGNGQRLQANDAWVSMIRGDGSLHTTRWLGAQSPDQRAALTPPLVLNDPFGSEIANGVLYVADSDGGTGEDDPRVSVLRRFDLATGTPLDATRIEGSPWINDVAVAADGTIYATQTGDFGADADPDSWRVYRVAPSGKTDIVLQGAPLFNPNGIAFDRDSNLVVVNSGDSAVFTVTTAGEILATEYAAQSGSDGIVIMPDGTKYISSVRHGGVSRLRRGEPAVLIATGIPGAASMCYDSDARNLVIPMTSQSGVAFVPLGE